MSSCRKRIGPAAARRWRKAEEYGFDHAWSYDHLSWRSLADQPWHATIPTLTAAATVTDRIGLGLFVASPNFRHPVPFAKELATLDDIAGGRVLVGVGSGGTGFDAYVLGQQELTPRERHARFVEFVDALDVLLRFEEPGSGGISFSGDWYVGQNARMVGTPSRRPRMPLLIAGNGPKTIRYAAVHGEGWVTTGGSEEDREQWWSGIATLSRRFDDEYQASGRQDDMARIVSIDIESGLLPCERRSLRRRRGPRSVARLHRCGRPLAPRRGDLRRKGVRPRRDSRHALRLAIGRPSARALGARYGIANRVFRRGRVFGRGSVLALRVCRLPIPSLVWPMARCAGRRELGRHAGRARTRGPA